MHQLAGIALCFLIVCTVSVVALTTDDEDVPHVSMEIMSSGDNATVPSVSTDQSSNFTSVTAASFVDQNTSSSTENPFAGSDSESDLVWLNDAVRDVAYYLRAYKFNEYDRRYETNKPANPGQYFAGFPKPPLRSLHWEVRQNCEPSFLSCMEYLIRKVRATVLSRKDDTAVIIAEQKWYGANFSERIQAVEEECQKLKKQDDTYATPFQGPIERFQWRTTASYYLCWYAMNEVPNLEKLNEPCDNFANCLDSNVSANNGDVRATDNEPFACILYSVCPDPCCPIRHVGKKEDCWNSDVNPCFEENPPGKRTCLFERYRNRDFEDIVLNRWNVTCSCVSPGYIWDSRFGTCVDVNECTSNEHSCDETSEVCVNLPGSYKCVCNWGYIWSEQLSRCTVSPALDIIKRQHSPQISDNQPGAAKSFIKLIVAKLFKFRESNGGASILVSCFSTRITCFVTLYSVISNK